MCQSLLRCAVLGPDALLLIAGGATKPARFYVLSTLLPVETASVTHTPQRGPTIGLGPVILRRYLGRAQIVRRSGPDDLKLAEFDRWGKTLDANVTRVLADNLASLLPTVRVVAHPWPRASRR